MFAEETKEQEYAQKLRKEMRDVDAEVKKATAAGMTLPEYKKHLIETERKKEADKQAAAEAAETEAARISTEEYWKKWDERPAKTSAERAAEAAYMRRVSRAKHPLSKMGRSPFPGVRYAN